MIGNDESLGECGITVSNADVYIYLLPASSACITTETCSSEQQRESPSVSNGLLISSHFMLSLIKIIVGVNGMNIQWKAVPDMWCRIGEPTCDCLHLGWWHEIPFQNRSE